MLGVRIKNVKITFYYSTKAKIELKWNACPCLCALCIMYALAFVNPISQVITVSSYIVMHQKLLPIVSTMLWEKTVFLVRYWTKGCRNFDLVLFVRSIFFSTPKFPLPTTSNKTKWVNKITSKNLFNSLVVLLQLQLHYFNINRFPVLSNIFMDSAGTTLCVRWRHVFCLYVCGAQNTCFISFWSHILTKVRVIALKRFFLSFFIHSRSIHFMCVGTYTF